MKRLGVVLVALVLLGSCGGGTKSYADAAAVAKAAGYDNCRPDSMLAVTDAVSCGDSVEVEWFKSSSAQSVYNKVLAASASAGGSDTVLEGSEWAIECVNRPTCVRLQKAMGGKLN